MMKMRYMFLICFLLLLIFFQSCPTTSADQSDGEGVSTTSRTTKVHTKRIEQGGNLADYKDGLASFLPRKLRTHIKKIIGGGTRGSSGIRGGGVRGRGIATGTHGRTSKSSAVQIPVSYSVLACSIFLCLLVH